MDHKQINEQQLRVSDANANQNIVEASHVASFQPPPFQLKTEKNEIESTEESPFQLKEFQFDAESPNQPNDESAKNNNPFQLKTENNNTGLPDELKSGLESMSGFSMDDVKVHYNSDKPAQLQAHAYAQGTDIHLGSGQERHLPHEAWHVVQQKQGRVQATTQLKAFNINDDVGLEKEADVMGAKAIQLVSKPQILKHTKIPNSISQRKVLQMVTEAIGMEAGLGELKESFNRQSFVTGLYRYCKKEGIITRITDFKSAKEKLNQKFSQDEKKQILYKFFKMAEVEQKKVIKEMLARKYHDSNIDTVLSRDERIKLDTGKAISVGESDQSEADIAPSEVTSGDKAKGKEMGIKSNLTKEKACVITAVMFSEGGGVLGANSVEELHFILSTRFRDTWRHYSEEKVYESLYKHLGYSKTNPGKKLKNLKEAIGLKNHGMVSIAGHMIGFKKDDKLYVQDNDHGLKDDPSNHPKKNVNIKELWTK